MYRVLTGALGATGGLEHTCSPSLLINWTFKKNYCAFSKAANALSLFQKSFSRGIASFSQLFQASNLRSLSQRSPPGPEACRLHNSHIMNIANHPLPLGRKLQTQPFLLYYSSSKLYKFESSCLPPPPSPRIQGSCSAAATLPHSTHPLSRIFLKRQSSLESRPVFNGEAE